LRSSEKSKKSEKRQSRFVLCVRNSGSEDLELRKVYQVLPNRTAAQEGYARVIDESGEDYLYPAEYFVAVRLPAAVAKEFVPPPDSALQPAGGGRNRSVKARLRAVREKS
jgi:hypothetical protein